MLILALLTFFIGLSLIGYGRLLIGTLAYIKSFPNYSLSLSDYSLLGIFVVIALAMLGNFFIPLSDFSGVVTLSLGVILLILFHYQSNLFVTKERLTSLSIMGFCVLLVIAKLETSGIMNYQAYKTVFHFDTGLYHMPFLQWISSNSIPIGLANLHGRLGFNSSWLIFHSSWRSSWIGWSSLAIVEGWIWTLGIWIFGEGLVNNWTTLRIGNRILLIALALIFFVNFGINQPGSVVSTDHASNIFALLTVVYFLQFTDAITEQNSSGSQRGILLMTVSSCLAITGKLSMLPVSLFPLIGFFVTARTRIMWKSLIVSLILSVIFFTLWILRNLLLSGCLVYPIAFTCLDQVGWGVGSQQAIIEKNAITGWARSPDSNYLKSLDNYDWLTSWFSRILDSPTIKLVFILLLSSLILPIFEIFKLTHYQENKKNIIKNLGFTLIILTAILGLLLWFLNGPDPRFSWSFLLLIAVPIIAFWLALFNVTKIFDFLAKIFQKKITYYVLLALMVVLFMQRSSKLFDLAPWDKAPNVGFSQKTLPKTGQIIYIPLKTSQSLEIYQCWAIPLPCTYYFNDQLSMDTIWGHIIFRRAL